MGFTNTLAYYDMATYMAMKNYKIQSSDVNKK